ncbi:ATP-dependent nuclease [Lactococcus lactis]|uniref:AAA family ATPase n=1 Tax=Lactococcus lactis subsp. lactis TaxID=1360 RepID=A0A1V0P4K0_LACLL|nr:ATP-binding protein [Lactococcus lactis]ARE21685.1 AAA family ATPase [Lactococcus lactis subsp. lactis]
MNKITIKKVTISNFRSFKNKCNSIDEINNLNMFTGKNNAGKTNVLRAINLFFNPSNYDPQIDMNAIKKITGGASKQPKIEIKFEESQNELKSLSYTIILDLNQEKDYYKLKGKEEISKLSSSKKISDYLSKNFKCVYLSTTDEEISQQAYKVVNDMILQYYKKRNREIRKTIGDFENQYKTLVSTFENNIFGLEQEISEQFEIFKSSNIKIEPHLKIESNTNVSDFLLENIKLELDDAYSQAINTKGAGIQRTSLILLTFFLLNQIYTNVNKIILLDEPEAFLYPLIINELKKTIEKSIKDNEESQIFLTSHSREFIPEINNPEYSFYNIDQILKTVEYARSKNDTDINKYSTINKFDKKIKNEVLKNYGLLDDIDDYEDIIVCEGMTDKNYLVKILEEKDFRPQIRFQRYSNDTKEFDYSSFPKGASSIVPILIYLDRISNVDRKVFVLIDGDDEGKRVSRQINPNEYKHLTIEKYVIPDKKEIEDIVFSKEDFIDRICTFSVKLMDKRREYSEAINKREVSVIKATKDFITGNGIVEDVQNLKRLISRNLEQVNVQKEPLLSKLESFFYNK